VAAGKWSGCKGAAIAEKLRGTELIDRYLESKATNVAKLRTAPEQDRGYLGMMVLDTFDKEVALFGPELPLT
jgi:hypothetical protein